MFKGRHLRGTGLWRQIGGVAAVMVRPAGSEGVLTP
jgi:hypothetical protein